MPERLKQLLDRDVGTVLGMGAVVAGAHLAEINLAIQIIGGLCGLIVIAPKVRKAIRDWKAQNKD